jgi:hypothetical protein
VTGSCAPPGELFYEHGFHAVGIDLIISRANPAAVSVRHLGVEPNLG